jgi:hypothetical protein
MKSHLRLSLYLYDRETQAFLDGHRLWIAKGTEGFQDSSGLPSQLSYFDLSLPSISGGDANGSTASTTCTVTYNEAECTFDVVDLQEGVSTTFKAKSKTELISWRSAINARSELASENNLIYMADEHVVSYETYREDINFRALPYLKGLSGTLSNRELRAQFRSYLENAGDEILLKFWEYCEDFRRFHPDGRLPYLDTVDDVDAGIELFNAARSSSSSGSSSGSSSSSGSRQLDVSDIDAFSKPLPRKLSKMSSARAVDSGNSSGTAKRHVSKTWPHDFKYSIDESNALGIFIFETFISDAKSFADIISASELSKIKQVLSQSTALKTTIPRTVFVKVQMNALKEIRRLFLCDFSRLPSYRSMCIKASMDRHACMEVI